jgi:hypothetical protein
MEKGLQVGNKQGDYNQQDTEVRSQDDCVPQRVTNGHIVVKGHDRKEPIL